LYQSWWPCVTIAISPA